MKRWVVFTIAGILSFLIVAVLLIGAFNNTNNGILTVINLTLLAGLIGVTTWYAAFTLIMANATVKMAEEMREQTIITSRPVMIQKAIPTTVNGVDTDIFSHFQAYNTGKGPAIELQVSLLNQDKRPLGVYRETSVGPGEYAIPPNASAPGGPFHLTNLQELNYYIVCEYQSIFSRLSKSQTWYQTWLPFQRLKSSQGDSGIRVEPGELEFREVPENERVDAWHKLRLPSK